MEGINKVKDRRQKILQLLHRASLSTKEIVSKLDSEFNILISERTIQDDIRHIEDVMNIRLEREHNSTITHKHIEGAF